MKNNIKIILAFSGGLDTSFCVLWLKKHGFKVVTLTVDTGGFDKEEINNISKQSKILGSIKHIFLDGKNELYEKIATFIIKGNILRGGVYPLCAGPERIIIAKKLVETAIVENAEFVAHGSTGAGNDQVRFDVAINSLSSKIKIITPIRELGIKREEEIKYLKDNNIPVSEGTKLYSINKGMLGITIGGKETKDSWESPPEEVFPGINPLNKTPDKPESLIISFEKGLPKALKHLEGGRLVPSEVEGDSFQVKESGIEIMEYLTKLGGKHGIGKNIHLGNTILGIKGRVSFAAPAITILIKAHKEMEKLVLTKWQLFWKDILSEAYGNFLHEALYFDPVIKDIEALIDSSQKHVTGDVKVKLFKGNIIIEGMKSPYSLMNPKIAVYGEENALWTGQEAAGFCKLYGLQSILAQNVKKLGDKHES